MDLGGAEMVRKADCIGIGFLCNTTTKKILQSLIKLSTIVHAVCVLCSVFPGKTTILSHSAKNSRKIPYKGKLTEEGGGGGGGTEVK